MAFFKANSRLPKFTASERTTTGTTGIVDGQTTSARYGFDLKGRLVVIEKFRGDFRTSVCLIDYDKDNLLPSRVRSNGFYRTGPALATDWRLRFSSLGSVNRQDLDKLSFVNGWIVNDLRVSPPVKYTVQNGRLATDSELFDLAGKKVADDGRNRQFLRATTTSGSQSAAAPAVRGQGVYGYLVRLAGTQRILWAVAGLVLGTLVLLRVRRGRRP
jgi:hypothetical protein